MTKTKTDRLVTNEDIRKYEPMIEMFLQRNIAKNWSTYKSKGDDDMSLGNSGFTMSDMRQHLLTELVIALKNYNKDKNAKESTFVFSHLSNRVGQKMKSLTKKAKGYGVWVSQIEVVLKELEEE